MFEADRSVAQFQTHVILNLYDSEPIWFWTYLILNLSLSQTYLTPNISDSEPLWFQKYLVPNLSDTETIWYWTY